jgi:hypothetical protein
MLATRDECLNFPPINTFFNCCSKSASPASILIILTVPFYRVYPYHQLWCHVINANILSSAFTFAKWSTLHCLNLLALMSLTGVKISQPLTIVNATIVL